MAGVLVDGGESLALQYLVGKIGSTQGLVLKLFKTNVTPAETDVVGTYTEATFTGYSAITLTGASWSVSGTAPTKISYAQQTFTSSADQTAQTIYGYYLVRATGGELVIAEAFASPVVIQNNGDAINITPSITAD